MNVVEAIESRRSVRNFLDTDISNEFIESILECGCMAPSAKNRQPWYFVILRNDLKDKIADMMIEYTRVTDESYERKLLNAPSTVYRSALVIKEAPVLILVFKPIDNAWIVSDNLSVGACVENMCLRAVELGLGSLWIRDIVYVSKEVAAMLNHSDLELNCALALGLSERFITKKEKINLTEKVEWH